MQLLVTAAEKQKQKQKSAVLSWKFDESSKDLTVNSKAGLEPT